VTILDKAYPEYWDIKRKLAQNIRNLRKKENIDQKQLAEKLIISECTVGNLEDTNLKLHHSWYIIYKVARYFNVTIDELIHGTTEMKDNQKLLYKIESLSPFEKSMMIEWIDQQNKIPIL